VKIMSRIALTIGTILFAAVVALLVNGVGLWDRVGAVATPALPATNPTLQETGAIITPTSTTVQQVVITPTFQSTPSLTTESNGAVGIITPTSTLLVVLATATPTSAPVLPAETSVAVRATMIVTRTVELRTTPDAAVIMHMGDVVEISYPNKGFTCGTLPYISGAPFKFATLESFCPDQETKTLRFSFPYAESMHKMIFDITISEIQGEWHFLSWVQIYIPRYGFG